MNKDLHLELKVRNGRILSRIEDMGYDSIPKFCKDHELGYQVVLEIITFKRAPISQTTGTWKPSVLALSEVLRVMPEDLFPEEWENIQLKTNRAAGFVGMEEVAQVQNHSNPEDDAIMALAVEKLHSVLDGLYPRYREVVEKRFGLNGEEPNSLRAISEEMGISTENVRRMEQLALRRLRHPSKLLKKYVPDSIHTPLYDEDLLK